MLRPASTPLEAGLLLFKGYRNNEMIMKRTYQQPTTEHILLHAGELMIPPIINNSGREQSGGSNPGMAVPGRTLYS